MKKIQSIFSSNLVIVLALILLGFTYDGSNTTRSTQIIVKKASDLSSLRPGVDYFIDGFVDMGSTEIIIPQGEAFSISGINPSVSGLTSSSDNYTMFRSAGLGIQDFDIDGLSISVTGTNSQVYDLKNQTGTQAFRSSDVLYSGCTSLGTLDGFVGGLESNIRKFGGTPDLTLEGSWFGGFRCDVVLVNGVDNSMSDAIYTAGGSLLFSNRFVTNVNANIGDTAPLFDFSPSNFSTSNLFEIQGAIIQRNGTFDPADATITPNTSHTEVTSNWSDNIGVYNTIQRGRLTITSEVTTTISSTDVFVDLEGVYVATDTSHFSHPQNGTLKHLGDVPQQFELLGELILDGQQNAELDLRVAIYRAASDSYEYGAPLRRVVNNLQGGRDVAFYTLVDVFVLNEDDEVNLQVANHSNTSNITGELNSFWVLK